MVCCIKCTNVIDDENEQYYVIGDMGPEIVFLVEQNLGHQVDENGVVCSKCFAIIMQRMPANNTLQHEDYELQHRHDNNICNACVWCRSSLHERRAHSLPEGPERQHIAETIAPREIPDGGIVCYACWIQTQRILQQQGIIAIPQVKNKKNKNLLSNVYCVWCSRSLARTRRHSIPEGPERNVITAEIYPREIPPTGLVCYACWVAARRSVQRAANIEKKQQNIGPCNY